uniref:chemotaxis protein CheB n=1 Tax=Novosphingobium sp. TaxID=1874826 RepID=UPI00262FE69D
VLTGMGSDGASGPKLMRDAGQDTLVQDRATAMVAETPTAAIELGAAVREVGLGDLGTAVLAACAIG